ncbi:hypothetical protein LCGC14_2305590 [marine sediment metagenome]|uniref:Response regulatory domain-containing protein n=1 Tax=marine sediment metagenome TaxID=412755 RepID=A0A0F9CM68_9ZZZZ
MSSLSNILLDKEILLESGTNELELLVFTVADYTFGINVAKVREVLPWQKITSLPKAHPSICGVFRLREHVIPCVSLSRHLGVKAYSEDNDSTIILTDFNQQQTAFVVDSVDRIYRLSWENILAVPGLHALSKTPVTALARHESRLIVMLDFEMMLDNVTSQFFRTDAIDNPLGLPRETCRILLAEDSPTVREAIGTTLRNSGYTQVEIFDNGDEAWKWIQEKFSQRGRVEDVGDIIISDVEMPQIDGFHLTKKIKEHQELAKLPVLLYSSIVTPDNHKKGNLVGAAGIEPATPTMSRMSCFVLRQFLALSRPFSAPQSGNRAPRLFDIDARVNDDRAEVFPAPGDPDALQVRAFLDECGGESSARHVGGVFDPQLFKRRPQGAVKIVAVPVWEDIAVGTLRKGLP